jgi:uncharacterized protein (TIGR03437 family)
MAVLVSLQGVVYAQQNRIAGRISGSQRFTLSGHLHPLARSEYDRGPVDPSMALSRVTFVLQPSAAQKADLEQLLAQQQDPTSANYHKWLTPEEYADRFGASQDDIAKIVEWLQSQHLTVASVARARDAVAVSGTAAQIESALHTEIHVYVVNGETHYANTTEPSLPAALQGVVQAIHGLHDFRLKPRSRKMAGLGVRADGVTPEYNSATAGVHYVVPGDFVAIFDIQPLYNAGIGGAGQTIAVVGQSDIDTSHLATFRSYFGLPATNLTTTLVPNTQDPGVSESDEQESDLDLEWSSAVAVNASLLFVYSYDVMDAVQYAIDQDLAPVVSSSYGECETAATQADSATLQAWAVKGNAEGITWVAASGDSGAADCYGSSSGPFGGSSTDFVLSVDMPASIPQVTGVGGTEFNEGSGTYWSGNNNSTTKASALSYIPETTWNDSTVNSPAASGGGASVFFAKPSWQTGLGVPADGARDVPDVALPASPNHDGYMVYTASGSGRQATAGWQIFGGTSFGAPTFSGILTLLNNYLVKNGYQSHAGLGNVNTYLYGFAKSTPSAFHDVTTGNNIVTATTCSGRRCAGGSTSIGYNAGIGYDQVTGLGSIDVYNFVTAWHAGALLTKGTPSMTLAASPVSISAGGSATLTATLTSSNGNTPSGTVTFSAGGITLGSGTLSGAGNTATASLTIQGSAAGLTSGSDTITAAYSGDSADNTASASATLKIVGSSSAVPSISSLTNAFSYSQSYAPGMALAIFGSQLALTTRTAAAAPLPVSLDNVSVTINGVAAPLYYISPAQLNVQVPYETPATGTVAVVVSNNGQTASATIQMAAAAPGIAGSGGALVPTGTAGHGQAVALYLTGAGAVQPAVATGATPAGTSTPVPIQNTVVTVGGTQVTPGYIGIPSWSVGVLQINITVPSTVATGAESVVVTVGGVASPAATLTVTQ